MPRFITKNKNPVYTTYTWQKINGRWVRKFSFEEYVELPPELWEYIFKLKSSLEGFNMLARYFILTPPFESILFHIKTTQYYNQDNAPCYFPDYKKHLIMDYINYNIKTDTIYKIRELYFSNTCRYNIDTYYESIHDDCICENKESCTDSFCKTEVLCKLHYQESKIDIYDDYMSYGLTELDHDDFAKKYGLYTDEYMFKWLNSVPIQMLHNTMTYYDNEEMSLYELLDIGEIKLVREKLGCREFNTVDSVEGNLYYPIFDSWGDEYHYMY